jgi:hypothetical protein
MNNDRWIGSLLIVKGVKLRGKEYSIKLALSAITLALAFFKEENRPNPSFDKIGS